MLKQGHNCSCRSSGAIRQETLEPRCADPAGVEHRGHRSELEAAHRYCGNDGTAGVGPQLGADRSGHRRRLVRPRRLRHRPGARARGLVRVDDRPVVGFSDATALFSAMVRRAWTRSCPSFTARTMWMRPRVARCGAGCRGSIETREAPVRPHGAGRGRSRGRQLDHQLGGDRVGAQR